MPNDLNLDHRGSGCDPDRDGRLAGAPAGTAAAGPSPGRRPTMNAPTDPRPGTVLTGSIFSFIWARRRQLKRGVAFALLRCLVIAPCPWLFQVIIDVFVKEGDVRGILGVGLVFTGLLLLHYTFSVEGAAAIAREVARMMLDLRGEIFNKLHFLNFGYLDRQKSGRLLSKYAFDTQKVEGVMMQVLNQFFPNLLYSFSISVILVLLNWQLSLVLLLVIPLYALTRHLFYDKLKKINEEARLAQEHLTGTASEAISALRLVRSFGAEKQITDQVDQHSYTFAQSRVDLTRVGAVFGTYTYMMTQFLALVTVAGGACFVIRDTMTLGTLLAFMAGLPIISMPVHLFAGMAEQYFVAQESLRSIQELLGCEYVEDWHGTRQVAGLRGEITFEGVTFRYSGAERNVLEHFDLRIAAGEHVALVGHSGAGKSTLTALILGLYKPLSGTVRIDGVPLSDLDMRWFRTQAAVVLQDSLLLSGSVAENLRLARPQASDEELQQAARLANAEEFILHMPDGYETRVGERGALLSGGQRQRLSIARAILRGPRILILDEATSALDYESERLVQQAIERLSEGRTVITIAHRLSTVRNADRVIVLRQGHIIEQGTFDELMAARGYFHGLVSGRSEQIAELAG
jgi:ATP-binding cassette subfamily B protein